MPDAATTIGVNLDVTYDLGILFLLRTIRSQHSFSLIDSQTSPLDDLKVFQPRDDLPFNARDQLDQPWWEVAYEKVTPTEYSTPSLIVTVRQLLKDVGLDKLTY